MSYRKGMCVLSACATLGLAGCAADPYAYDTSHPSGAVYPSGPVASSTYPNYPNQEIARYGYVESMETIAPERSAGGPGVGAIGGAIAGGLLGHQVGSGSGNTAATIGGAVVGGVIGHQVEQRVRDRNTAVGVEYHVRVRMDDGTYQTFRKETHDGIRVGDRVRVERGNVFLM